MKIKRKNPSPQIGSNGYLLDVPENNEFIAQLRATPSLTPIQLIKQSKVYESTANVSLAHHLLKNAIKMIAVTWHHGKQGKEGINSSIIQLLKEFGSSFDQEDDFPEEDISTQSSPAEGEIPGLPSHAPVEICEFKCTWWTVFFIGTGLLWENCGHGWKVIGVCMTSEDAKRPDHH